MQEQNLRDRWTLQSENPKLVDSLNLAIERARLQKGYKPGQSAPELELKARQADLSNRQRRYIEGAQAQRDRDVLNNGVSQRLPAEVDFSTHSPYIGFEPENRYGHGGLKFDPGTPDAGTVSAPTPKVASAKGKTPAKPINVGKNFSSFEAIVNNMKSDEQQAIARGTEQARLKRAAVKENAARNAQPNLGFKPIDAYGLKMGTLGASMTRNGQTIDVPRGGHFDEEALNGPRVVGSMGAPPNQTFQPEAPVGDGVLPNDDVQGQPDFDYREPPTFTDRRKPATLLPSATVPVAHRAY